MSSIHAYLNFNGNCMEAMMFYQKCLGGELSFQTVGESPLSEKMPARMKNLILHSTLINNGLILMGSDMTSEQGLLKGNAVSLVLNCKSEKEIKDCYKKLSMGGEQTHPLEHTFWNALFGGLTDRYGYNWMLHYEIKKSSKKVKMMQ
ncbi:MAG: VOC family protein [Bacteroidetes bacterium]|nr:VOC family protein [Pseudomonadota bacterium]MBS1497539.1 VOC family protein [Bacteroidota bacterium]MBS1574638.1 VOC family protein [Bacteroidota bacterium]